MPLSLILNLQMKITSFHSWTFKAQYEWPMCLWKVFHKILMILFLFNLFPLAAEASQPVSPMITIKWQLLHLTVGKKKKHWNETQETWVSHQLSYQPAGKSWTSFLNILLHLVIRTKLLFPIVLSMTLTVCYLKKRKKECFIPD